MPELLKLTFEYWIEKRWLKEIDRAIDRYRKAQRKSNREYHVMNALIKRYNELYDQNLGNVGRSDEVQDQDY